MASFEEFKDTIKLSSRIFERAALVELYKFLVEESGPSASFMIPNRISSQDGHQTCLTIQMGATAALRSVRQEFVGNGNGTQNFIETLINGRNNTRLLISVKSTHHPLNAQSVSNTAKRASLINIICL